VLQVPLVTATQLLQVPVQALLQHTPSTQCLEAHALSLVPQAAPRGRLLMHLFPTHWAVPKQSVAVEVQEVLQASPAALQA
jgi:hypothetical protein